MKDQLYGNLVTVDGEEYGVCIYSGKELVVKHIKTWSSSTVKLYELNDLRLEEIISKTLRKLSGNEAYDFTDDAIYLQMFYQRPRNLEFYKDIWYSDEKVEIQKYGECTIKTEEREDRIALPWLPVSSQEGYLELGRLWESSINTILGFEHVTAKELFRVMLGNIFTEVGEISHF